MQLCTQRADEQVQNLIGYLPSYVGGFLQLSKMPGLCLRNEGSCESLK